MVYINTINHPFNIMPEPDTESEISDIMKYVIMALMLVFGISYVYSSSTTTDLPAPDSKRSKPTIKQKPDNIAKNANNKIGAKRSDSIDTIGHAKAVHVMFVRPIATHPAIALRDHVSTWIVKVPLTPFKAPLIELPFVAPEDQPPFLLYKPEYLTPVRNQGDCGSCWAFAVCDMLADRMMIASGGHFRENLSVQQLLACFDRDGCDGGSPEEACFFMQSSGFRLNTSKFMKYKQYKGGYISSTCPKDLRNPEIGIENDSVRSLVEYIEEEDYDTDILQRNISNMKRELIIGGPFYCAMSVYDDLFSYSGTSVYERNPKADIVGGHAIEIKVRKHRIPEIGDKLASIPAQKGTIGMIYPQEDMPFTMEGIVPDIILNVHAIPSRMTINMLMELISGKTCSLNGTFQDATAFCHPDTEFIPAITKELESHGYDSMGWEHMRNGMTGETLKAKIFIGCGYYQRLKHLVSDKCHSRAKGNIQLLSRQPCAGRSRHGGLRFGEMEVQCMIAHGSSIFLKERLFDMSDPYTLDVCPKCGTMVNNKVECMMCKHDSTTKINIPYACKLLFQELQAMGIKIMLKPES